MKDEQKGSFFRELDTLEIFNAQKQLEEEVYNSMLKKMINIDLTESDVQLQYAKLRGAIEAIQSIQSARAQLIQQSRSRQQNS